MGGRRGKPKTERKERKRKRGLREKQKATTVEWGAEGRDGRVLASFQKHKERRGRPKGRIMTLMSPPRCPPAGEGL